MLVPQSVAEAIDAETKVVLEHARLRDAVVGAAKAQRKAERAAQIVNDYDVVVAERATRTAVDALLEFEAKQDQK